ncbi:MAG TPA: ferritin [Candidatus Krumholzibacteriaceae bacterium]|nr:ferritin [Candidatus Krumholzibacteriaceae bacterium]
MLSDKMCEALAEQVNKEIYSAYLYLSMSSYFDSEGLKGFSNWYFIQYREEMDHAMRIYDYIQEQGFRVKLKAIDEPPSEFGTPLEVVEKTLEHEKFVTSLINDLMDLSIEEKDHATKIFLQWFVSEQIEEESSVTDILDKLKLAGEKGNGLFMIDRELMARVYIAPEQEE